MSSFEMADTRMYTTASLIEKLKKEDCYPCIVLPYHRLGEDVKNIIGAMGNIPEYGVIYLLSAEDAARLLNILETML